MHVAQPGVPFKSQHKHEHLCWNVNSILCHTKAGGNSPNMTPRGLAP
jgi:hypothetical protein